MKLNNLKMSIIQDGAIKGLNTVDNRDHQLITACKMCSPVKK